MDVSLVAQLSLRAKGIRSNVKVRFRNIALGQMSYRIKGAAPEMAP
jgi:hypothetical protein